MKKTLALILAFAMLFALTACGGTGGGETDGGESSNNESSTSGTSSSGQAYEVKMLLPYIMTPPGAEAIQSTEDVINDYLLNTLGITDYKLDLNVLSYTDATTIIPMDLASAAKWDIVNVEYNTVSNYVSNGYLLPLDDYVGAEMKDAVSIVEDSMPAFRLNDHYYAIPANVGTVTDYRFIYNKEMVDAVCDMSGVDTWDEVLEVLDELKIAYPDEHFLCYASTFPAIYQMQDNTNIVGVYTATVGDSTQLVNYYATDAYRLACEKAYELMQRGMLDPEGSANTMGHDALTYSGSTKGVIMGHSLTEDSVVAMFDNNNTYGAKFDCVTFDRTAKPNPVFGYGIPYTSQNPTYAAQFLNLIWTDPFIYNTLGFGKEGTDYLWSEDHSEILYPEGYNQTNLPYNVYYALHGIGDVRMIWQSPGGTTAEDLALIADQLENSVTPPAYCFTPSTDNVANQIAAVSNVVEQYNNVLIYGDVDPAEYLPQFLSALESAGINDILADYQTQLDAWLGQ